MRWTTPALLLSVPGAFLRRGVALLLVCAYAALAAGAIAAEPGGTASEGNFATAVAVTKTAEEGAAQVVVTFSKAPTYSARVANEGKRLIVDVPNAGVRGAPAALLEPVGPVAGVMTQASTTPAGSTTRVIVTLSEKVPYRIKIDGNLLVLSFGKAQHSVPESFKPTVAGAQKPGPSTPEIVRVLDVRYEHEPGEDRVVIELSGQVKPRTSSRKGNSAELILAGAQIPDALERRLEVAAFGGPLGSVSSFQGRDGGGVTVEVEKARDARSRVMVEGNAIVWSFFRPGSLPASSTGVAADGGVARQTRTIHRDAPLEQVPEVQSGLGYSRETTSGGEQVAGFAGTVAGQAEPVYGTEGLYGGRRIDLDLKDADIHNVLRLLADVGRVNIITADNVSGDITIRMRNVPWDQALDVVLQSKKLGLVRKDNIIRVAPLKDLEQEREVAIMRAKQELQLAPLETRLIPISYANAEDLQVRARELLSGRGTVSVDARTNVLITRDVRENLDQIEELLHSLDTQTPQVLIEARIIEATSRYTRELGIQWGGDASFSSATGNPTGLAFPNAIGIAGGASDGQTPTAGLSPVASSVNNPNFAVNLPAAVGTGAGGAIGMTFGSVDGNFNVNLRLSAAESSGMVRILSSPRVLTLDNKEARIKQGTLIPFSQVSAQGVQTVFQEAKLQLLVKPHVTADGGVSMNVKVNRDEPDFNQVSARGDPTILKREAETNLLVMDGHTAVIGGIYTRNSGRNLTQVPFFGDIPLIGILFQQRRASDVRGELVIFITPRIVNRAEALGR